MKRAFTLFFFAVFSWMPLFAGPVLVEAESFADKGGWVTDHQAFVTISSPYLLAHGIGRPVADARTEVRFEKSGTYHVYVSTYNWTSPWYEGKGPGKFQVAVDGRLLPKVLGDEGSSWGWQYAGEAVIGKGDVEIVLKDLTGFDGRVDAIYFSERETPPAADYAAFSRRRSRLVGAGKPVRHAGYDLVVAGGGIAGCTTALSAARMGLKVALVDNLPFFGGNAALGIPVSGRAHKNLYPRLGYATCEIAGINPSVKNLPDAYKDNGNVRDGRGDIKFRREDSGERAALLAEAGVDVFHNVQVYDVRTRHGKIAAMKGVDLKTVGKHVFKGALFADCTGDGVLGYLAGADYHIGREARSWAGEPTAPEVADSIKNGASMAWVTYEREDAGGFPRPEDIPWALQVDSSYFLPMMRWNTFWETGMNLDCATQTELIRDHLFRAVYGNWAFLKANDPRYANRSLDSLQYILMKRESRRLLGDVVLTENDVMGKVPYDDASFTTTWPMDTHYANPQNSKAYPGWEWSTFPVGGRPKHDPVGSYDVPYRCLYSRNVDNLFIGGRCMSVSQVALGTVRVQLTLGMAGEVIAMAAKVCRDHDSLPRSVYTDYLPELKGLMTEGVPGGRYVPDSVVYLYPGGQDSDLGIVENGAAITRGPGSSSGIEGPEIIISTKHGSISETGDEARMELYIPEECNGLMVIGAPGGGYYFKSAFYEGAAAAEWYNAHSVAYCNLIYREPHGNPEIPLTDIRNAMMYCRAHAAGWGVKKIGVTGYSAGGHLAAAASTLYEDEVTRPDFAILNYPWLSFTENDSDLTRTCKPNACAGNHALEAAYSLYDKVTPDTPPTILFGGGEDSIIFPAHMTPYYDALVSKGVDCSLHIFPHARHGWGFYESDDPSNDALQGDRKLYYELLENFLEKQKD